MHNSSESQISLNIAIVPSKEVSDYVIEKSCELSKLEDTYFVLDGEKFYPHITLYQNGAFVRNRLNDIVTVVKEISKTISKFTVNFSTPGSDAEWLHMKVGKSKDLMSVYKRFVQSLSGYVQSRSDENFSRRTKEKIENIVKYKAGRVINLYDPHLTLTRFIKKDLAEKYTKELKWKIVSMPVRNIAIYKMGEHGTCTEELVNLELG